MQEFLRKLIDNLEEKMDGTAVAGLMAKLFKGTYKSFTRCINVDYEVEAQLAPPVFENCSLAPR